MVALSGCRVVSNSSLHHVSGAFQPKACNEKRASSPALSQASSVGHRPRSQRISSCRSNHHFSQADQLGSTHYFHRSGYASLAGKILHQKGLRAKAVKCPQAVLTGPPKPATPSSQKHASSDPKRSHPPDQPSEKKDSRSHETDVVIIGAGASSQVLQALGSFIDAHVKSSLNLMPWKKAMSIATGFPVALKLELLPSSMEPCKLPSVTKSRICLFDCGNATPVACSWYSSVPVGPESKC
jgi:hypothetical protein